MKNTKKYLARRAFLATVAASPALSVLADPIDPERAEAIAEIAAVRSEVSVGAAYLTDEARRFGQYSGVGDDGGYLLANINFVQRDNETGSWLKLSGRNLGLDNREVLLDHYRQGVWRYFVGYSQTPRYEPYVVNTGLTGMGTTAVAVNGTAIRPVDLAMKRDQVSVGFDQAFGSANAYRLRFTHEEKDGARLFGRGTSGAAEFLTEPIDRTTETWEASVSHSGKNFQISGGYYGTLFINRGDRLDISSTASNALTTSSPPFTEMSMPLSNDSHQLFVSGGYSLTPTTRATFKVSDTVARQDENFMVVPSTPGVFAGSPRSLKGRVDTLLAYFDLTSFAIDQVDLQANVRFEDRDDKTPESQYMTSAAPNVGAGGVPGTLSGVTGFNKPRSWSSLKAKVEAGYQLPDNFKLVGGFDTDHQKRNAPEAYRKVNFREETDESTARIEVKRSMLDTLSGSLAYSVARRTGSAYLADTYTGGSSATDLNPLLWADRDRTSYKVSIDWAPLDELTFHAAYDQAEDHYDGLALGPRSGSRSFTSLDGTYMFSSRWQATFWLSRDDTRADQQTQVNPSNPPLALRGQQWQANLRQLSDGAGVGLHGKTRKGVEVGVDGAYYKHHAEQRMMAITGAPIASLPDFSYRMAEVKLFASYPLQSNSGVRFDYVYQDWKTSDWTWNGWTYTDGTTLTQSAEQKTHFVGASYFYRWR